jgi:DNA-binding PadR family transcriptional regulator
VERLRRVDRDLPALTVLALLFSGPRHTYEMHRMMIDTHKDFVTGLPRSLYHAVDRLVRDELIRVQETVRAGVRPERTVYALSDAGRTELSARVRRLLSRPDPDTTLFVAALSFVACLSRDQVREALQVRAGALTQQVLALDEALAAIPESLPRLLIIETEYERGRLAAEREWVQAVIADIESARLEWPDDIAALTAMLPEETRTDT